MAEFFANLVFLEHDLFVIDTKMRYTRSSGDIVEIASVRRRGPKARHVWATSNLEHACLFRIVRVWSGSLRSTIRRCHKRTVAIS